MSWWVNEWVSECMNGRVNEWMNKWVSELMIDWVSEWINEWVSEWMSEWENWGTTTGSRGGDSQTQVSIWTWGRWVVRDLSSQREQSQCVSSRNRSSVALFPWGLADGKRVEWENLVLQLSGPTELRAAVRVDAKAMALKTHRNKLVVVRGQYEQAESHFLEQIRCTHTSSLKESGVPGATDSRLCSAAWLPLVERLSFLSAYL